MSFAGRLEELLALGPKSATICQAEFCGVDPKSDAGSLLAELAGRTRQFCKQPSHPRPGDVVDAINDAIEADFLDGHTCTVDGWLLSRTEALICLLAKR